MRALTRRSPALGFTVGLVVAGVLAGCSTGGDTDRAQPTRVFVGTVLTMDAAGSVAEAVSVDPRGNIVKVGTEAEVRAGLPSDAETITLAPGQVLLPGFVEPHMHLDATLLQSIIGSHDLAPCRPAPYETRPARVCDQHRDVLSALQAIELDRTAPDDEFVLAMNLDPSRQVFVPGRCGPDDGSTFGDNPRAFLNACVSSTRPVLVLDQSGHLGYVNDRALEVVCKGTTTCPVPASVTAGGGDWVRDADGNYTGLLQESSAYLPFQQAMTTSAVGLLTSNPTEAFQTYRPQISGAMAALRQAGLTTITDIPQSPQFLTASEEATKLPDYPVRVVNTPTVDVITAGKLSPTGPQCDPTTDAGCRLPKWLGVGGAKLWADGSTQGCTALLAAPARYLPGGHCDGAGAGRADFGSEQELAEALRPLWEQGGWRFQVHANGNGAIRWSLNALSRLQQRQPSRHRMLLIHSTVGDEQVMADIGAARQGRYQLDGKPVPALDVSVTHLIGHVAYWGDTFAKMLPADVAQHIDAVDFDRRHHIPFSFHSDSTVTPAKPLWFVEQAVTRRTWAYPGLTESYVLGPQHRASIDQALRAVTIEPARQQEIDRWVGSIEPGKVADFVVLGGNPYDHDPATGGDPTTIHQIPVVRTYLGGVESAE